MITKKIEKVSHKEAHLGENDCIAMHFFIDNIPISSVMLAPQKDGTYETHISDLPEEYLNKGLGVEIYKQVFQYCIKNKIYLYSSRTRCEDAERLWKSKRINKIFNIYDNGERYFLISQK